MEYIFNDARRLSDVLKRKRPPKRGPTRKSKNEDSGGEASSKNTSLTSRGSAGRGKSPAGQLIRHRFIFITLFLLCCFF